MVVELLTTGIEDFWMFMPQNISINSLFLKKNIESEIQTQRNTSSLKNNLRNRETMKHSLNIT